MTEKGPTLPDLLELGPCRPIDAHCHVAWEGFFPRSFIEGVIDNAATAMVAAGRSVNRRGLLDLYLQKLQDPNCDELLDEMKRARIEKAILLVADFTYALKDCETTVDQMFLAHARILQSHPGSFVVFGGVDPRWGKDGVDLFERSVSQYGFRGLKVYPPCGFSPSDPMMDPYYEICRANNLPVLVHIGPTSPALPFANTNPFQVDGASFRFPEVNFILAHGAVSFVEECAMMCAFRPNVYLDLSAIQGTYGRRWTDASLRSLFARGINHKIIFGSDWPVFRLKCDQPGLMSLLLGRDGPLVDTHSRELRLIFEENIRRICHFN